MPTGGLHYEKFGSMGRVNAHQLHLYLVRLLPSKAQHLTKAVKQHGLHAPEVDILQTEIRHIKAEIEIVMGSSTLLVC